VTADATRTGWRLMKRQPLAQPIALLPARPLPAPREPAPRPAPPTRTGPDGATLQLALGDLHRHTDISRCSSNWDGPLGDALRYAYDVAPLDFLAITDHFDHMTKYDWWRTLAFVDAWDAAGRMATLRAYERTDMATGHRNVLSRDGGPPLVGYRYGYDPARDDGRADTPAELWPLLQGGQVLTIPHTPAGMLPSKPEVLDWSTFNPAFDRLVEVFQSYRGSSEAVDAPRAIPGLHPARYVLPLALPEQGSSYAYARVTCADGELMWSSPVRLFAPGAWPGPDGPEGAAVKARVGDVWGLDTDPLREKMRARDEGDR
jgi:hypothetical protein